MPSLQPLALARPRSAHRFEAFSLKLARRVTLYHRNQRRCDRLHPDCRDYRLVTLHEIGIAAMPVDRHG